jgi:hypothetical protein
MPPPSRRAPLVPLQFVAKRTAGFLASEQQTQRACLPLGVAGKTCRNIHIDRSPGQWKDGGIANAAVIPPPECFDDDWVSNASQE